MIRPYGWHYFATAFGTNWPDTTKMAVEEMAGIDVLCSNKTGRPTPKRLTVDNNMVEVTPFIIDWTIFCLIWLNL